MYTPAFDTQHIIQGKSHPAHSTIITKVSKQTIKVERYYENGQIKFTGNYQGMPDELKDKDFGDKFTDNNYETPNNARIGIARWWHDNGQLFTEGEHPFASVIA